MNSATAQRRPLLFVLPGAGADPSMYGGAWRSLRQAAFLDWPAYRGDESIDVIAKRLVLEHDIRDGDSVVGSSLGGIVGCEIDTLVQLAHLVLVGSARTREEINPLLALLHPLLGFLPLRATQQLIGKVPADVCQLYAKADVRFMRAMVHGIFDWCGRPRPRAACLRIHGRHDHVISCPPDADVLLDGGHLIALTHAELCVQAARQVGFDW